MCIRWNSLWILNVTYSVDLTVHECPHPLDITLLEDWKVRWYCEDPHRAINITKSYTLVSSTSTSGFKRSSELVWVNSRYDLTRETLCEASFVTFDHQVPEFNGTVCTCQYKDRWATSVPRARGVSIFQMATILSNQYYLHEYTYKILSSIYLD